jgi:hypothetical protein
MRTPFNLFYRRFCTQIPKDSLRKTRKERILRRRKRYNLQANIYLGGIVLSPIVFSTIGISYGIRENRDKPPSEKVGNTVLCGLLGGSLGVLLAPSWPVFYPCLFLRWKFFS